MLPSRTSIPSSKVVGAKRCRTTNSSRRTKWRQEGPESPFNRGRKRFHLPLSPSCKIPTAQHIQASPCSCPGSTSRLLDQGGRWSETQRRRPAPQLFAVIISFRTTCWPSHGSPPSGDPLTLNYYSRTESVPPDALPSDAQPCGDDRLGNSTTVSVNLTRPKRTVSSLIPRTRGPSSATPAAHSVPSL